MKKKLLFITGTRADYGKIKSVIKKSIRERFNVKIFVTGMHLLKKYGETFHEIKKILITIIFLNLKILKEKKVKILFLQILYMVFQDF